jgi:hypothetical protein
VRVLEGLRSAVTTPLRARRFRRVQIIPLSDRSPQRLFRWVNAHLAEVLQAEPHSVDGWCPEAVWRVGRCRVSSEIHDVRGLLYVLRVERKGSLDPRP